MKSEMIYYIVTVIFLLICTVMDLRSQKIWWPLSIIFMVSTAAAHLAFGEERNCLSLLGGIGLGLGVMAVSWITREAIGYGDGLTVAACGAAVGFVPTAALFILALCFSAVWSGVLLVSKKAGRKDSFPFVPFLLAAQLCVMVLY